jgi:hypothetical protein
LPASGWGWALCRWCSFISTTAPAPSSIPLLLVWPTAAGLVSGWLAARDRRATWLAAVLAACGFLGWLGTGERDWLAVGVAYGIAPGALIGAALGWWLRRRRTH